ncbi:YhcN/YlaJ family sporulation lipoprotein [Peribacillus faecalis]|nr:YhcN/YlaJ family sporulation lipoprotein [Peribacillus faecalis]
MTFKMRAGKAALTMMIGSLLFLTGCEEFPKKGDAKWALFKTTNPHPAVLYETADEFKFSEELHDYVLKMPEIYDAAIIVGKERVLVAYKVKQMKRFKMKKIEKELKKKLEKKYKDRKFTVSSDFKIFLEAVELNEELKDKDYSRKKARKQFKKIIKLEQEKT